MTHTTRVLVVDDDGLARQLYAECLGQVGHQVSTAASASEAIARLGSEAFDVLVTDLILPDEDGLAILAEAKRRDPGIEVIVLTGVDRVDPAVRAIKSGAADYLVKPVNAESLQLSVSRCVAQRRLLQENALLRQHLALVETAQRLATTLDRDHLYPRALAALEETLGASGILLLTRRPGMPFELSAAKDLEGPLSTRVSDEALPQLEGLVEPRTMELAGAAWRAVPAEASGEVRCIFLAREPRAEGTALANANYLAEHVALALHHIHRLTAAEDLAYLDDLTKLYNVRFLHQALDREITNSRQTGSPFSVLFIDLDHFKAVNDTHGHLVGSKLLVEMAGLLKSCVREIDVAARYGGDEYVIILLHTAAKGALKVAERIRWTIESHRFLARDGLSLPVTACIGVSSYPEHAQDKSHILEYADRAMYRGKQTTRNTVYVSSPASDPVSRTG